MSPPRAVPLIAVASLLLTACGDLEVTAPGAGDAGQSDVVVTSTTWPLTCDSRMQDGLCRTWSGEQTASTDAFVELCTDTYGGATSAAECSPEEAVGSCLTDQGFGLELSYVYFQGSYAEGSARAHCEGLDSCQFSCEFVLAP